MTNAPNRLNELSADEKRALLAQLLRQKASKPKHFPLSFAQQRLWFLEQLRPGTATYNTALALRLRGELSRPALQRSLDELVRRHEALRTTFALIDGQPLQQIAPPAPADLPVLDLRTLPEAEREPRARALARAASREPFDLERGPLLRIRLIRLDERDHVLLFVMHHIMFDNWSMGVFADELSALYGRFLADPEGPSGLQDLPIQYADFAVWQREWLQGAELERQLAYWKAQLADAPPVLALPTDRPHQPIQTFRGGLQEFRLAPALSDSLKALAQREGATLFMTLLAAYQLLLSRYAGQPSVVVGSPVAGRTRTDLEGLIGLFINTLALRTDLGGNPSFRALLGRVRETCLGAYAHQDLPFEKLVEELHLERDLSHTIIFQAVFDLHNAPGAPLELPGLAVEWWDEEIEAAKFDLSLAMTDSPGGLIGGFEYNADLFDAATIERMAGHFQVLLAAIAADPGRPIGALPLLGEEEYRELVVTRNATGAAYNSDKCFHHLFAAQVERTPDAPALVFGDERLSYRELDRRANQLARYLRGLGVGAESRVGICLQRSSELVIGLLGIFKAGGAFVPIDPSFPAERMSYILDDAAVSILLTQDRLRERLPDHPARIVALDAAWRAEIAGQPADDPGSPVRAENLAYLIYTSGSTGRPKGVLIPHRGLINYLDWCLEPYTVAEGRGAPVHASIAADAIFPSLFAPLLAGTTVFVMPEERALEALGRSLVAEGGYSMVKITPSQLEVMTHDLPATDAGGWVKTFVIGAEEVRGEVLNFWQRHAPETRLLNEYGPTETVVGCSIYDVPRGRAIEGSVPIGLPIANIQFYVLDRQMQPVPIGVPGELYIGGDGVAWGYHNRPELTAEKFVPDPFSDQPGARLYRTGDLVRSLLDRAGNVEFLGRIDDQVKIRGYRVEPGEVGAQLLQHPAVREVVVLAREDAPGQKRLAAYVVAEAGPPPTVAELREFLVRQVPEYMVPADFVFLDAIPLAPHGKIDRKALPAPAPRGHPARAEGAGQAVAPRSELERRLAAIWQRILGMDEIGVGDNFFELGGHSLLVVRLMAQIKQEFGRAVPLAAMFQGGTIEQLAALLGEGGEEPWSALVPIQPDGGRPPFFCVHPTGGNVMAYANIARHLAADQPFYGIQARELADAADERISIEEMAAQYVAAVRSVQPAGPYQLGGWSFGGLVAFEMARQLGGQGEEVALLAMIDSRPPAGVGRAADITDATILAMMAREQALQAGLEFSVEIDELQRLDPEAQLRLVLERIRAAGLEFETELDWVRRFVRGFRAREQATHAYQPGSYAGPITLFKTVGEDPEIAHVRELMGADLTSAAYGWDALSDRPVDIRIVEGFHGMLIQEPYVRGVARQLQECLDQAQRNRSRAEAGPPHEMD